MPDKTGTREWAEHSKNIFIGCSHNCRYCYARADALRYKRILKPEHWTAMELNRRAFTARPVKLPGRIMFPTTHDIMPAHIALTIDYLRGWLTAGNHVLLVTKPHYAVISRLCEDLVNFRSQITFRFTIGSLDDEILSFWEPGAPARWERLAALEYAQVAGFRTSVSCEPYLDRNVRMTVKAVEPFVTDTIWIGMMNKINSRVDFSAWSSRDYTFLNGLERYRDGQPTFVRRLYEDLKDNPKIRWKDSVRRILGLANQEKVE
ncbi:MAG: radical SAM protein [Syntrophorhabdaceae bacterium]|nr:radical SAM protein [Syntrophorhabdaceae bacterium]